MDNLYILMKEFLSKRGIEPREEEDGKIIFSLNNMNFFFNIDDSDPFFFRLSLPYINNEEIEPTKLEPIIYELNKKFKVAKIIKVEPNLLWIIADIFIYSTDNSESLFDRVIQAMSGMLKEYHKNEQTIQKNKNEKAE